jgi:hypothetical protein
MQVKIKFKAQGSCSALGNFAPGGTVRVSAALARHLVEEARCAEYDGPAEATATQESKQPAQAQGFVGKVLQRINRRKSQP